MVQWNGTDAAVEEQPDEATAIGLRSNERALLEGIKAALDPARRATEEIEVEDLDGNVLFKFRIRGLDDDDRKACSAQARSLVMSNITGTMVAGEPDPQTFGSWMIYTATVSTIDGQNMWDHPEVREMAGTATGVLAINKLLSGKKDKIVGAINRLSGTGGVTVRRTLGN